MSIIDYQESQKISQSLNFHAMIMAAMRKADNLNLAKLEAAFPDTWAELKARYNAPGGALNEQEAAFVERQLQQREQESIDSKFDEEYD